MKTYKENRFFGKYEIHLHFSMPNETEPSGQQCKNNTSYYYFLSFCFAGDMQTSVSQHRVEATPSRSNVVGPCVVNSLFPFILLGKWKRHYFKLLSWLNI